MNKQEYLKYVDHFNHKRYDDLVSYFAEDISVEYYDNSTYAGPPPRTLHGRKEFVANYKTLHEHTKEVLEVGDFLVQEDLMFVELYTEFHTFKDSAGPPVRKKGDVQLMTNWVMYTMKDGKMKRIRIAHFRMHDPKTAKYK
jgi:hypothetical protein